MSIMRGFNADWLFIPEQVDDETPDHRFERISLPHSNKMFPGRFVDNAAYQFISTYRKRFLISDLLDGDDLDGKRVFIDFDGAMLVSTVCLNGKSLGVHKGGYTPFSFEITDHLIPGENLLTVHVDSIEREDVPPYGGRVDYLTFGGLYRDVNLRVVERYHLASTFVKPLDVLTSPRLEIDVQLSELAAGLSLAAVLEDNEGNAVARQTHDVRSDAIRLAFSELDGIALWSLDKPTLYNVRLTLSLNGHDVDLETVRFGFREAIFRDDGQFYLNGQPLKLFGLNRHQTYPYIGAAAPARLQELDAEILKHELGCNIVRTSHYAQSPHFLNRCDEIGLLVFEELAGWQHIGDAAWQELVMQDLGAMIERDRHHPSIILWGVRVNESPDCESLYTRTNALAHELDPTRQTGGVRNFISSQFLEDVFTLNDFTEGIQTPRLRPHLITEFGGHMFPTKTWDHEERRVEHALKHVRKHNLQMGHPDVAGAIGWCAFDYHTHKDFGSGDRICYHGVMDIYRLPKMAAYFYRSQKSPSYEIVLHAATNWTMGDRDGGGNNPLMVFSNCDEIEVSIGNEYCGRFLPDREQYPHLPYPPFTVKWPEPYNPWGTEFMDLSVRGYLKGQVVAEHRIDSNHIPHHLRLGTNTLTLKPDGSDMARIAVQIVDKYGNVLPYQPRTVELSIEGDAALIGENPLVLMGGQAACFLKARRTAGNVIVRARAQNLPLATLVIQIGQ